MALYEVSQQVYHAIGDTLAASLVGAAGIVLQYPGPVMIACASVGTGLAFYAGMKWMDRKKNQKPTEAEEAAEMRRRLILDQMYADRFGDALFDMLMANEIDRHEYKRACRRFGIGYRLSDLLVRKNSKRGMKHRIVRNCEVIHHTTKSMAGKAIGPKPGEGVPIAPPVTKPLVRKVWIAVGKAKLRLKSAS